MTALLDGIDLRYVRIGRVELVRRVYAAVRDGSWNTVPGAVSDVEVTVGDDAFDVRFQVRHQAQDIDFTWAGAIQGERSGRITYGFEGRAETDMHYNRIGICIHHPWRETAGAAFRARTAEGEIAGSFPDLIGPQPFDSGVYHPLFPAFDRIEIAVAEGLLALEFDGDLWESEDHRNWTDANFKTYSTPMALGFPHHLVAGAELVQRIAIVPSGIESPVMSDGPIRIAIGSPTGTKVPVIGLGQASHCESLSAREVELLRELAPAHLRVEVRLGRNDWRDATDRGQSTAAQIGCPLEIALHLRPEHAPLLRELSSALSSGPTVARVLVILEDGRTATPEETTPTELVDLARAGLADALPDAAFVGGTQMYFTEINRTRPNATTWDGVCFSITPQIHAFTDVDIVENLDAQGENVRSALALAAGKPVIVSPVTLRRRVNFHAAEPEREPAPGELPDAVDVRQPSLLGAAWTVGSLKYLSEAGASSVTYFETTGWRGVMERESGSAIPDWFRSKPAQTFPLFHPLADVAGWHGADVLRCDSEAPLAAVVLGVRCDDGALRFLVANVTPRTLSVSLGPLDGVFHSRRLSEVTVEHATAEPVSFRTTWAAVEAIGGELTLRLRPYEVVRVDPA